MDLVAKLSGDGHTADPGADKADVHLGAAHEGERDIFVDELLENLPGVRPGQREAADFFAEVFDLNAVFHVIHEPAHVPLAQVVRAHNPPRSVAPIEEREVAL